MSENQPGQQPGGVTFNYTLEKAKYVYSLLEKPAEIRPGMAIVTDEGFRKYLATQLKIPYISRADLNKPQ